MKKTIKTITALVLLLATVSLLLPGCGGEAEETTEQTVPETTAAAAEIDFSKAWKIIRPDDTNDYEVKALQVVSRCLRSLYGNHILSATDFVKRGEEVVPGEYEILIGETNRTQSQEICGSLGGTQGVYRVVSENVIVIAGGSPEATYEAAVAFAKEVFGYEDKENADTGKYDVITPGVVTAVTVGLEGSAGAEFPDVILNSVKLKDYTIVTGDSVKYASVLVKLLRSVCGEKLNVITAAEYKEGPAIMLGYTPGYESGHCSEYFDNYSYYVTVQGETVAVDWKGSTMEKNVYESLINEYFDVGSKLRLAVTLDEGIHSMYILEGQHNRLFKKSETVTELASGVNYYSINYKDGDGKPVKVLAVTVEKGSARFYAGLPGDANSESSTVSTVLDTVKAAVSNGKTVYSATNAGFFDMNGTGLSRGIVVKEGVKLRDTNSRPCFAQLKDGSVGIYTEAQITEIIGNVNTAVAGNAIIMKNGSYTGADVGTETASTRHPRTAVGIRANGDVVIIEVDGRQAISNGASYLDLITVFREFGCVDAINLDGGGSSTMVIKDGDGYKLMNSPSDGSMRKVQDSLLVIAN